VRELIERWLGIEALKTIAARLSHHDSAGAYARSGLDALGVEFDVDASRLGHVPATGSLVVVANHPFGGIDGLIAVAALSEWRPDLLVLGQPILTQLGALGRIVLPLDPFGRRSAVAANAASLRRARRHLQQGGALLIFPAGEVSHFSLRRGGVSDGAWQETAVRLALHSGARLLPLYFGGRNSLLFQCAGYLHPLLRTLLLPREALNKSGTRVPVVVGRPIDALPLEGMSLAAATTYLRMQCFALGEEQCGAPAEAQRERPAGQAPLAAEIARPQLRADIAALPADALHASSGELQVFVATAASMPALLPEIGRLRELTFRAVGEGTGRRLDLDSHDQHYEHLFIWHRQREEIVGAYRLGRIDELRRSLGNRGVYLTSLFEFREPFFKLLGPALELGRSFIRAEYQRSFAPLLLLWQGIGEYVGRHPRYARLIGPASISEQYDHISRSLLVEVLRRRRFDPLLGSLARPRQPFRASHSLRSLTGGLHLLPDVEEVGTVIARREADGKGIPVLLRQYLRLGARIIGFNVDPDFGNALDCLILLDLRATPDSVLRKYLSREALRNLRGYWRQRGARRHPVAIGG